MYSLYVNKSLIFNGQLALLLCYSAETPAVAYIAVTVVLNPGNIYITISPLRSPNFIDNMGNLSMA